MPLAEGDLTPEELSRFSEISFETPATSISDVGEYIIRPFIDPPLDSITDILDPRYELDIGISEKFEIEFRDGVLSVEKLSLNIIPDDLELTYGDTIDESMISLPTNLMVTGL